VDVEGGTGGARVQRWENGRGGSIAGLGCHYRVDVKEKVMLVKREVRWLAWI